MKILKPILSLVVFLTSFLIFGQENENEWTTSINEVEITIDSIDELKSIDWKDMFSVFEGNSPKDSLRLAINLKDLDVFKEGSNDTKIERFTVAVVGLTEDLDILKKKLKKSTKAMIKVIDNMNEQK